MPLPHFIPINKSYGYSAVYAFCDDCCGQNIDEELFTHTYDENGYKSIKICKDCGGNMTNKLITDPKQKYEFEKRNLRYKKLKRING